MLGHAERRQRQGLVVLGESRGVPLVLLQHPRAPIDDWNPALLDALASRRQVIVFNTARVARPSEKTPSTVEEMARVVETIGEPKLDVLGYSLGGQIAFALAFSRPKLIRRVVAAASRPGRAPRDLLYAFFPETPRNRAEGFTLYTRIRRGARSAMAQGRPTLVPESVRDLIFPAFSSFAAIDLLPYGRVVTYRSSAHGSVFRYHDRFAADLHEFLDEAEATPVYHEADRARVA